MKFLIAFTLFSQFYFGKNKVQYKDFNFIVYETQNFDIHVEEGSEKLGVFAGEVLEAGLERLTEDFGFGIEKEIPVIIYNSPTNFSQTNIILEIIEESIGGFSELFKYRIVVPFTGSYKELRDVLLHELVHIFQFQLFFPLSISNLFNLIPGFTPPLWLLEGLAEYVSKHGGEETQLFMRDLVIEGNIIPLSDLRPEHGFILYKEGESFFLFLEENYGRKKVFEFINTVKLKRGLDEASKAVFGTSFRDLENKWIDALKVKYWPLIPLKDNFSREAIQLTDHTKTRSFLNKSVAISPSGTKILFISDREDYTEVYVASAFDGKILKKIVRAGRSASFEHLPTLERTLAWGPSEKSIAVMAVSRGNPVLYIFDYESGKITQKIVLELDGAFSPCFSSDGNKVAFVGLKDGYSDIYICDLRSKTLERLTYDIYEDKTPVFAEKQIIFVSDRPRKEETWNPGNYGVFSLKETGVIEPIITGLYFINTPQVIKNDLFFVGPERQLYRFDLSDSSLYKITDFLQWLEEISISQDGKIAFTFFSKLGWNIGTFKKRTGELVGKRVNFELVKREGIELPESSAEQFTPYKIKFSPDYIYGTAGYSTLYGFLGEFNIGISDIMGNHRFYIASLLTGDIAYSSGVFEYWYLPKRVDLGLRIFQIVEWYRLLLDKNYFPEIVRERDRGIGLLNAIPLSKFLRFEIGAGGMERENTYYYRRIDGYYYEGFKISNLLLLGNIALVFDNSLWRYYSPIRGSRIRLDTYSSFISDLDFRTIFGDVRHYIHLTPRSSFAIRLFGGKSMGRDPEYFFLGGMGTVRGFNYYEFYGNNIGFANLELRVPFIDYLKLAFPLPLAIKGIRGVVFADAGAVWSDTLHIWDDKNEKFGDIKVGVGSGLRIAVSDFLFKLDFAKPIFSLTEDEGWKIHFGIGADF